LNTRSAAVAEIADRTALSGMAVASMLTTGIPNIVFFGGGSLRRYGRYRARTLYHRGGSYGLPIRLFWHLFCMMYGKATGRC